jgi:hypothetical protein
MLRVRLLWATGERIYFDLDAPPTPRAKTILHTCSNGSTSFWEIDETDADGIDTYAESGCGWTRAHANHALSTVLITPQGTFSAWAAREGQVTPAGTYHALATAKAAADLEACCVRCGCPYWTCDQER